MLIALALSALAPFTRRGGGRLVHALSAPVGYLFRPYIIYRIRERTAREFGGGGHAPPRLVTGFFRRPEVPVLAVR